jgi:hypothetical protein
MTIPVETIAAIRLHLSQGHSQRQVARDFHGSASRSLIQLVARGTEAQRRPTILDDLDIPHPAVCSRCPDCGRLVRLPCIACRATLYADLARQRRRRKNHNGQPPATND